MDTRMMAESVNEYNLDQIVAQLVAQLRSKLTQEEDAETAIAMYKKANWAESLLEQVKHTALLLAEHDLEQKGIDAYKTSVGSAGWTKPEARQLNEQKWLAALAENPTLMRIQRDFDLAQGALRHAQEAYMELIEPRFFIR